MFGQQLNKISKCAYEIFTVYSKENRVILSVMTNTRKLHVKATNVKVCPLGHNE